MSPHIILEGFARKDFLVQNQRSLPRWHVAFASTAPLYSIFGSLARFHSQSHCWSSQGPLWRHGHPLQLSGTTSLCDEHLHGLASNSPISPLSSFTALEWVPSGPGDLSMFSLSIRYKITCTFTAIWVGISAPSAPKDSLEVGIL